MHFVLLSLLLFCLACDKENTAPTSDAQLKFQFQFDSTQVRLNNIGQAATMPAGHAAQNPQFRGMSAHFIELVEDQWTPYKSGQTIYQGAETSANNPNPFNFTTAINFDQAIVAGEGEPFLSIPIKDLQPGTYRHVRVSVSYQSYDVRFNLVDIPSLPDLKSQSGTVASFLGYNTQINELSVRDLSMDVNDTKLQGFWAFESNLTAPYNSFNNILSGQAPANATTVVNPLNSPVPPGSCVVSGTLDQPLVITGEETEDQIIDLSFSINQSFEWEDRNGNGEWDISVAQSTQSEPVVDMGLRGLIGKLRQ